MDWVVARLHRAGCEPSHTLMIGDSWENDILAAREVGMRAVWIFPETPDHQDDTISHIRDLATWLANDQAHHS